MSRPPTRGLTLAPGHAHAWGDDGACRELVDTRRGVRCFARRCRAASCEAARSAPSDFCRVHVTLARRLIGP
jgi:hypothetical protein